MYSLSALKGFLPFLFFMLIYSNLQFLGFEKLYRNLDPIFHRIKT